MESIAYQTVYIYIIRLQYTLAIQKEIVVHLGCIQHTCNSVKLTKL